MSEQLLTLLAAWLLGVLLRPLLDRAWCEVRLLRYAPWWPTRCAECHHWQRRVDTNEIAHRLAGWVHLCDACYARHYKAG